MDFARECFNASGVDSADILCAKGAMSSITVSLTKNMCVTVVGFAPCNDIAGAGFEHSQPWRCFNTCNRLNQ